MDSPDFFYFAVCESDGTRQKACFVVCLMAATQRPAAVSYGTRGDLFAVWCSLAHGKEEASPCAGLWHTTKRRLCRVMAVGAYQHHHRENSDDARRRQFGVVGIS